MVSILIVIIKFSKMTIFIKIDIKIFCEVTLFLEWITMKKSNGNKAL